VIEVVILQDIFLYSIFVLLISTAMYILSTAVLKKKRFKFLELLNSGLNVVVGGSLITFGASFVLFIFLATLIVVYSLINKFMFFLTNNESVSIYLSISLVLILFSYVPQKFGYFFLWLFNKTSSKESRIPEVYSIVIEKFRVKILIYLLTFVIVLVTTIEGLLEETIIKDQRWIQLSPIALKAVVTFIAYDRFHKAFVDEFKKISEDVQGIFSWIRTMFVKEEREISG
jgi:hypothetical protein